VQAPIPPTGLSGTASNIPASTLDRAHSARESIIFGDLRATTNTTLGIRPLPFPLTVMPILSCHHYLLRLHYKPQDPMVQLRYQPIVAPSLPQTVYSASPASSADIQMQSTGASRRTT
jgi:hypothetical protein